MSDPISVLIVDDHAMFRGMLREKLEREPGIVVIGDADNAGDAVSAVTGKSPDVVLMDIDMPGESCFDAAARMQAIKPDLRIIFVSAFFHDHYIERALAVRAAGYLTKGESAEVVVEAIRAAGRGERTFSRAISDRIVIRGDGTGLADLGRTRVSNLSPREIEVLRYVARGLSQKEIARFTHRSVKTVHNHCTNIMAKLQIHDRVELARFAIREGLAEA